MFTVNGGHETYCPFCQWDKFDRLERGKVTWAIILELFTRRLLFEVGVVSTIVQFAFFVYIEQFPKLKIFCKNHQVAFSLLVFVAVALLRVLLKFVYAMFAAQGEFRDWLYNSLRNAEPTDWRHFSPWLISSLCAYGLWIVLTRFIPRWYAYGMWIVLARFIFWSSRNLFYFLAQPDMLLNPEQQVTDAILADGDDSQNERSSDQIEITGQRGRSTTLRDESDFPSQVGRNQNGAVVTNRVNYLRQRRRIGALGDVAELSNQWDFDTQLPPERQAVGLAPVGSTRASYELD